MHWGYDAQRLSSSFWSFKWPSDYLGWWNLKGDRSSAVHSWLSVFPLCSMVGECHGNYCFECLLKRTHSPCTSHVGKGLQVDQWCDSWLLGFTSLKNELLLWVWSLRFSSVKLGPSHWGSRGWTGRPVPTALDPVMVNDVTAGRCIRIIVKSVDSLLCPSAKCCLIGRTMLLSGNEGI